MDFIMFSTASLVGWKAPEAFNDAFFHFLIVRKKISNKNVKNHL